MAGAALKHRKSKQADQGGNVGHVVECRHRASGVNAPRGKLCSLNQQL